MRLDVTYNEYQTKIITALAFRESTGKAKIAKQAVYKMIAAMPEKEHEDLLKIYDKMSPAQRRNPQK